MKRYIVKLGVSIDEDNEQIAERIVANRIVSGKGVNEISVESVKEIL
jgi:hypothetical protein